MQGEGHIIISADLADDSQRRQLADSLPILEGIVHCAGVGVGLSWGGVMLKID